MKATCRTVRLEVRRSAKAGAGGFSLVELLVVVAVIALLASITLPALQLAGERSRRVVCSNNIRQNLNAWSTFAVEHDGKVFIDRWIGGAWMWDWDAGTRDAWMAEGRLLRDTMYCPSCPEQNADGLWNFAGFCVSGYWYMVGRADGTGPGMLYPDEDEYVHHLGAVRNPAGTELVTDATIGWGLNFSSIQGGFAVPHRSAHLDRDRRLPVGGMIGFVDGRAEWRAFQEMKSRASTGPGSTSVKYPEHWW